MVPVPDAGARAPPVGTCHTNSWGSDCVDLSPSSWRTFLRSLFQSRRVFETENAPQHPKDFGKRVEILKPGNSLKELRTSWRRGELNVTRNLVLHLSGLLKGKASQKGL